MRFCFMFIKHHELDEMKSMWNNHCIREVRKLYFMPEQSRRRSFRFPVNKMDISACHPFCELSMKGMSL